MLRERLYFFIAWYFQVWAKIVLSRWDPFIIAVVGSAGKTTTLFLLETVLRTKRSVKISHKTNAVTSVPLDILGLKQINFSLAEWLSLFVKAPLRAFTKPLEEIYICEMDSDRTNEMMTHTRLIQPDIACVLSLYPTHTENFKGETEDEIFESMVSDVSSVFFNTKKLIVANGDDRVILESTKKTKALKSFISLSRDTNSAINLVKHSISLNGTLMKFEINNEKIREIEKILNTSIVIDNDKNMELEINFPYAILTKINGYGVGAAILVGFLMGIDLTDIKKTLREYRLPPGRMSLFAGKRAITIIDSTYNASRLATIDAIETLKEIGGENSVVILGDMRELGLLALEEHKKVAEALVKNGIKKIILVGPLTSKYVYPFLLENGYKDGETLFKTATPKELVELVKTKDTMEIGDTILVKGSQNTLFLEGLVEQLLASKKDIQYLCRRESLWDKKRQVVYT
jgi:UDP-N-acetylmuramyl pentapeptide synthase